MMIAKQVLSSYLLVSLIAGAFVTANAGAQTPDQPKSAAVQKGDPPKKLGAQPKAPIELNLNEPLIELHLNEILPPPNTDGLKDLQGEHKKPSPAASVVSKPRRQVGTLLGLWEEQQDQLRRLRLRRLGKTCLVVLHEALSNKQWSELSGPILEAAKELKELFAQPHWAKTPPLVGPQIAAGLTPKEPEKVRDIRQLMEDPRSSEKQLREIYRRNAEWEELHSYLEEQNELARQARNRKIDGYVFVAILLAISASVGLVVGCLQRWLRHG
jgi:hypothetical protein